MSLKVTVLEKVSHCIFCGGNLTKDYQGNICPDCQKKVLCRGMEEFKSHLKMMMLGVEHTDHKVGSDIILTAFRQIAKKDDIDRCKKCSACCLFNGVGEIISKRKYVDAGLHRHTSKLKKFFQGGENNVPANSIGAESKN